MRFYFQTLQKSPRHFQYVALCVFMHGKSVQPLQFLCKVPSFLIFLLHKGGPCATAASRVLIWVLLIALCLFFLPQESGGLAVPCGRRIHYQGGFGGNPHCPHWDVGAKLGAVCVVIPTWLSLHPLYWWLWICYKNCDDWSLVCCPITGNSRSCLELLVSSQPGFRFCHELSSCVKICCN